MTDARKIVLLVEDNEDNRTIYRTLLEHCGFRVIEARNGREGVDFAFAEPPDVVLMDLSMPVMDGFGALRLLREDKRTRALPIIALTAHALAGERDRGMAAGFDSYLAKPIEPRDVLKEVIRFIGAAE